MAKVAMVWLGVHTSASAGDTSSGGFVPSTTAPAGKKLLPSIRRVVGTSKGYLSAKEGLSLKQVYPSSKV